MAKSSFAGPASASALVHARTSGGSEKSEVVVLGTDGSDAVLDPSTLATQATLAAVLTELGQKLEATDLTALATTAGQATAQTTLASILAAVDGLEALLAHGTFAYAAGVIAATVDVPAGARVRRVAVVASPSAAATIVIAGGGVITVPAGMTFDEHLVGDATAGGDVAIGGTPASYYVAWTV